MLGSQGRTMGFQARRSHGRCGEDRRAWKPIVRVSRQASRRARSMCIEVARSGSAGWSLGEPGCQRFRGRLLVLLGLQLLAHRRGDPGHVVNGSFQRFVRGGGVQLGDVNHHEFVRLSSFRRPRLRSWWPNSVASVASAVHHRVLPC